MRINHIVNLFVLFLIVFCFGCSNVRTLKNIPTDGNNYQKINLTIGLLNNDKLETENIIIKSCSRYPFNINPCFTSTIDSKFNVLSSMHSNLGKQFKYVFNVNSNNIETFDYIVKPDYIMLYDESKSVISYEFIDPKTNKRYVKYENLQAIDTSAEGDIITEEGVGIGGAVFCAFTFILGGGVVCDKTNHEASVTAAIDSISKNTTDSLTNLNKQIASDSRWKDR